MTVRTKLTLLMAVLVCANAAVWGAKQILAGLFDPILRAVGA
jgi:hypothetical protein